MPSAVYSSLVPSSSSFLLFKPIFISLSLQFTGTVSSVLFTSPCLLFRWPSPPVLSVPAPRLYPVLHYNSHFSFIFPQFFSFLQRKKNKKRAVFLFLLLDSLTSSLLFSSSFALPPPSRRLIPRRFQVITRPLSTTSRSSFDSSFSFKS